MKLAFLTSVLLLCSLSTLSEVHAFSKKRPKPQPQPTSPAESQAYPTRVISFGKFLSTPFTLPDGKTKIDMSVMLPELLLTEMHQAQNKLRARGTAPIEGPEPDRFVLKGGITAFEASTMTGQITIGWKPGVGDIGNGIVSGAEGKVTLNVGVLDMDFHIVDTQRQQVVAVGRGHAVPAGLGAAVTVDFGFIQTGADFVYRSPMAPLFRKAAREAVLQMARDPQTNFLMDWDAEVSRVLPEVGRVFFNAGARDDIHPGNVFTVYDSDFMRLGEVKVQSVEHESSGATYEDDPNGKLLGNTRVGDAVKIYFKNPLR